MATFQLVPSKKLVLLGSRVWKKNEQSNPITFVELADPETYDKFSLIADRDCKLDHLVNQSFVKPEVSIGSFNGRTSVTLTALNKA